jgi:peptide/nickel transport system substrate-binding protein
VHYDPQPEPVAGDQVPAGHPLLSRRGLFKLSLAGGALIVGPGLLAACGADDTGNGGGAAGSSTPDGGSSTAGGSTPASQTAGQTSGGGAGGGGAGGGGGEITVGAVGDISDFDPYKILGNNFIILSNLNTFLIDYDDSLKPRPAALTKWELNQDNTQVTLTLRPDLKLQTGKTWTADDLVAGFKRAANPDEGNQLYGPMAIVKDYQATDEHTVVLTFTQPVAELLVTDLLESFPAMDGSANSNAALATKPASGGPFSLISRDPGNDIVVGRFADYWDADNVHLDKVTFRIFSDADSLVAGLQSNAVDVIYNFPPKNAAQLKDEYTILEGYPGALVDCLRMNPNKPPFDNIKLRQAIAHSLDRDRIVQEVYFGYGGPLYLPWGPNSPATDPAYQEKNAYDLDLAAQLWKEAGSPKGATALANGGDALRLQMLQILQQDLKQIGFDLQIESKDLQTYNEEIVTGKFAIAFNGLGNTSKSPSRIATNSIFRTENNVVLGDKLPQEYVDAIHASEQAVTPDQAKAAYAKLNEVISTQAFGVPVCVQPTLIGIKKSISGVTRTVDNWLVLAGAQVSG